MSPLLLVTYAIGLFLGVPVIARELERGTVRLAWWLTPSRWRWYLARLLPILVVAGGPDLRGRCRRRTGCSPRTTRRSTSRRRSTATAPAAGCWRPGGLHLRGRGLRRVVHRAGPAGGHRRRARRDDRPDRRHERPPADPGQRGGRDPDRPVQGSDIEPGDMYIDQKFVLPDGTLVGYEYFNGGDPYDQNGNPLLPAGHAGHPGRALPVRRGARGAGARRRARSSRCSWPASSSRGGGRAEPRQNWTGVGGRSAAVTSVSAAVAGPRRDRIVTAPNRKTDAGHDEQPVDAADRRRPARRPPDR